MISKNFHPITSSQIKKYMLLSSPKLPHTLFQTWHCTPHRGLLMECIFEDATRKSKHHEIFLWGRDPFPSFSPCISLENDTDVMEPGPILQHAPKRREAHRLGTQPNVQFNESIKSIPRFFLGYVCFDQEQRSWTRPPGWDFSYCSVISYDA